MAAKRDYYEVLGVNKNASADEIKSAYKQITLKWHPYKHVNDSEEEKKKAEEIFKEASEAYSVLSDPDKKAKYDRFGHAGLDGQGAPDFSNINFEDLFGGAGFGGAFGGGLNDFLNNMFGGGFGGRRSARPQERVFRGRDIRTRVKLTLEEIARGVEKEVSIERSEPCPDCDGKGTKNASDIQTCSHCHGSGQEEHVSRSIFGQTITYTTCSYCGGTGKEIKNPCRSCGGTGIVRKRVSVKVNIPAGVENGMQLTVTGAGHAGQWGGPKGDLLVLIEELPHQYFLRQGKDLFYTHTLSVTEAMLGTEVTIPGLDSSFKVKVEPGTQSGSIVRLKGRGMPGLKNYSGSGSGDLYVKFLVWIPRKLSKKEREVLESIKDNEAFRPDPNREDRDLFEKMRENF